MDVKPIKNESDYDAALAEKTGRWDRYNLMNAYALEDSTSVMGTKRLWDADDDDRFNQVQAILKSPFLRSGVR